SIPNASKSHTTQTMLVNRTRPRQSDGIPPPSCVPAASRSRGPELLDHLIRPLQSNCGIVRATAVAVSASYPWTSDCLLVSMLREEPLRISSHQARSHATSQR